MGMCVGTEQGASKCAFSEENSLRYPGWDVHCSLCDMIVDRKQWQAHAEGRHHARAAYERGVDLQTVNTAIFRQPAEPPSSCARCGTGFGCCSKASYCELCGEWCCVPCVSQSRKILSAKKRRVRACGRCQQPLPVIRLLDQHRSVHPPEPGTCRSLCPPVQLWQHVASFLDYQSLNSSLVVSRAFLKSLRLPFNTIEQWDDAFRRGQRIGSGSYGDVFKSFCHLPDVRCNVAVKVIRKSSILSLRKWRYLIREIDIQSQIQHPNAIQLLGPRALQSRGQVYVIMELAGKDLFDHITEVGPLPEPQAARLSLQLMTFISDLHSAGVVHRDIKPENLLLVPGEGGCLDLKVCDFGFARFVAAAKSSEQQLESCGLSSSPRSLPDSSKAQPADGATAEQVAAGGRHTQPLNLHGGRACALSPDPLAIAAPMQRDGLHGMTPCGTFGFAPPEMIAALRAQQSRAWLRDRQVFGLDIFGAGVVIHVLLTAHDPFPIADAGRHLQAVQRGLKLSHPIYQRLSPASKSLIQRMLAYDPRVRPSALAVLNDSWFIQMREAGLLDAPASVDAAAQQTPVTHATGRSKPRRTPSALVRRGRHSVSFGIHEDGHIMLASSREREQATPERLAELMSAAEGSYGGPGGDFLTVPRVEQSLPRSGMISAPGIGGGLSLSCAAIDALPAPGRGVPLRRSGSEECPIDFLPSPSGLASHASTDGEHSVPLFSMD